MCAYGEPWIGAHPLCAAHGRVMTAQFDALVASGHCDAAGYTPNERAAQARKAKERTT